MSPSDPIKAQEEAALWLMLRQAGLSETEQGQFAAWLSASQNNVEAWARAEAAWSEIDAEDDPLLDAMRTDALSARPDRSRRAPPWAMAAAAVLVVGVLSGLAWKALSPSRPSASQEIALAASPTFLATGEKRTVNLADGSQAILDPGAALAVRFTPERRDLRLLQGHALFEVRHETRPFAVAAADTVVLATGTRFAVRVDAKGVSATLERGSVTVTRKEDPAHIVLVPGDTVISVPGRPMLVSRALPVESSADHPDYLEFRDTPLSEAADAMNRYAPTPIRVVGAAAKLKLNGRFRMGDSVGFVTAVTEVLPVRQRIGADGAIELWLKAKH